MGKGHLVALLVAAAAFPSFAQAAGGNLNGIIGFRQFDEGDWSPTDTHGMLGAQVDFSYWDFPLHVELGLRGSRDDGDDDDDGFDFDEDAGFEHTVSDFTAGIMIIPDYGPMRPYFDAGLAMVQVRAEVNEGNVRFEDDDSSPGVYIGGGILWRLTPTFNLGFDARYLGGTDVRIFGNEVDVDSYSLAMKIGYGWDLQRRGYDDRPPRRRGPRRY
jgi:opacity protein-like surface antigen